MEEFGGGLVNNGGSIIVKVDISEKGSTDFMLINKWAMYAH